MCWLKCRPGRSQAPTPSPSPAVIGQPRGSNPAGLVGPVQIEMLDGLDVLVLRGNPRDVEEITQILKQIEQLSAQTQPTIETYQLQYADGESLAWLVKNLYEHDFSHAEAFPSSHCSSRTHSYWSAARKTSAPHST